MVIVKNENVDTFDIDGTLVMHEPVTTIPITERVRVEDPINPGFYLTVRINRPMVRLLLEAKGRGSFVVVWSRGGYQWAANVIEALKLRKYVNIVMSKPLTYFDDTPAEKWLTNRVYIGPNETYKQIPTKEN